MSWLLPLVAPVLAVWVRTLITAGITTPFNGDHNVLDIVFFLGAMELSEIRIDRAKEQLVSDLTDPIFACGVLIGPVLL